MWPVLLAVTLVAAWPGDARAQSADAARVRTWFAQAGLPASLADLPELGATEDDLIEIMRQDKKAQNGKLTFILARAIGDAFIAKDIVDSEVTNFLREDFERK